MKHREYNIYSEKDCWKSASHSEWIASVKTDKRASIVQVVGVFGPAEYRNFYRFAPASLTGGIVPRANGRAVCGIQKELIW